MNRTWKERWAAGRALVDRRLRLQLCLFLCIFAIMVILVAARLVGNNVHPLWAIAGFVAGLARGYILARTKVIGWNPSAGMVVGTMDTLGVIILITYLTFLIFRSRIIGSRINDAETVGVSGLAMTGSAMLGRVHFTMRGIRRLLVAAGFRRIQEAVSLGSRARGGGVTPVLTSPKGTTPRRPAGLSALLGTSVHLLL